MSNKHYYSLDEISKLLSIPKSTLRYWEKEKLITSYRNEDNSYREYTTTQLIDICEIKFYRDLNFSISDIKKSYSNSYDENHNIIENARNKLYEKIEEMKKTISEIEKYQHRHTLVSQLKQNTMVKERPNFDTLFYFHPGKTNDLIKYLKDPSILTFVNPLDSLSLKHFATFEENSAVRPLEIIWEINENNEYFCFLLTSKNNKLDENTLNQHLKNITDLQFSPKNIIGRYLVSQEFFDYYQVWVEAEKI